MGIFDHWGGRPKPPKPPVPTTCGVAIIATDAATGGPLEGADVRVGTRRGVTNRDGYRFFDGVPRGVEVAVSVILDGYVAYVNQPYTFNAANQDVPIALEPAGPPPPPVRPPLITRSPLPPLLPGTYDKTPPPTVPAGPDLLYYRGNFCGIRVAGAPVVPGGPAASNADLMMACLLDNYPREWQEKFLDRYAGYGYTHLQRSVGHALYYGKSLDDFVELTKRAQQRGLYADQWLISNELPGFAKDQDAGYWKPILDPILDRLLGDGALDLCCPSWQMDQVNHGAPGNATISIIAYVAAKVPRPIPLYTHWMNEALAWWKTGGEVWRDQYQTINVTDRFSWWQAMRPYLTGGHHQGDTTLARTDPTTYQGKLRDTLNNFQNGRMGQSERSGHAENFRLDEYECTAQDQFGQDGQTSGFCTEDEGDRVGFTLACTKADGFDAWMSGYGNGARRPDGSPL